MANGCGNDCFPRRVRPVMLPQICVGGEAHFVPFDFLYHINVIYGTFIEKSTKKTWRCYSPVPYVNHSDVLIKAKTPGETPGVNYSYLRKPEIICSSASFSVRPSVISLISCSPAILPMAAS